MNTKKYNVEVVLLLTLAIILMVATGAAAQECRKKGEGCSLSNSFVGSTTSCCQGLNCDITRDDQFIFGTCQACLASGDTCGLLHPCCGGYHCTGFISGQCVRNR
ncbi:hypothetical protein BVRB_026100 [Beta vulgaris subsp. vulgaris]|uniref:Uncharacterized protein n=1 Tax=Beta vulgaris subsp. vulgaris TaxID=3555 RepID=A0A0J8DT76_BETVV|nr:hypothetical protein BVRB_026100 [Beta vulgaris subsp. vulgaris]